MKKKVRNYIIKKGEEYYVSTPSLKDARSKLKALVSYNEISGIGEIISLIKETKTTEVIESIDTNTESDFI